MKTTEPRLIHTERYAYWKMPDGSIRPHVSGASVDPHAGVPHQDPGDVLVVPATVVPPGNPADSTIQVPVVVEEDTPKVGDKKPGGKTFTVEDIEKARQQERDKVYGRLEATSTELAALKKAEELRQAAEVKRQADAEEAQRKAAEGEMSARELLEQREKEWNERFSKIEQERHRDQALLEREREFTALQNYRSSRISTPEVQDSIMPELLDMVNGTTPDEIESSIASLQERTARILEQVTQAQQVVRQSTRTASVTAPPVGPMENDQAYETYSAEDLSNMDMATYAKHRDRLLGAAGQKSRDRGLLG